MLGTAGSDGLQGVLLHLGHKLHTTCVAHKSCSLRPIFPRSQLVFCGPTRFFSQTPFSNHPSGPSAKRASAAKCSSTHYARSARSGATSLQAFRFIPIRDLLEATDVLVAAGFRTSLWADRCRCQDVLGDHVSACPRLRCGLERAATCLPRGRSNCGYAATRPLCRR